LGIFAAFAFFSLAKTVNNGSACADPKKTAGKSISCALLSAQNTVDSAQNLIILEGASLKSVPSPVFVKPQTLATMADLSEEISQAEQGERDIIQYTVKEGDTLASLAGKFKISLETILWANNLKKGSTIKSGQKLVILPVSGVMHIINEKETISQIAKLYKADQDQIVAFNQLGDASELMVGDIIVVPGGRVSTPTIASTPILAQGVGNVLPEGFFIAPTTGKITQTLHLYNAVDIANQCGTPVFAAAGGKVQVAASQWPFGNYVKILHPDSVVSIYAHLSKISVAVGEDVSQGQMIGSIGNTGQVVGVTGCHLHFDVRGTANPLAKYKYGSVLSFKK
jgi:lysostaphin